MPKDGAPQSAQEIAAGLRAGWRKFLRTCVSRARDTMRSRFARCPLLEAASRSPDSIPSLLRVGAALCFYGHGTFGFIYKESWVPFFSYFAISREWARLLDCVIGSIGYLVATLALLIPIPSSLCVRGLLGNRILASTHWAWMVGVV